MSDSESCTSPPLGSSSPKSANPKRCNKPQMEKKRRERINLSLNVLKQLVLEALKKDTSQYSKLEKADILEMTVKHLRDLQRRQLHTAASTDTSVAGKYRAGFTECASEVTRYLSTVDGLKPDVRDRLMQHLNGCVHRVNVPAQQPMQVTSASVAQAQAQAHYTQQQAATATSCMNVLPVASVASSTVPATRPIQIQIPVATSPTSLPGAGVQALQLAASVPTAAVQQQRTPSPQQHTSATFSPVSAPAYIGAFQVIPSAQAAFMLPQGGGQQIGLVNPSGAIYATVNTSPVQQAQLHQMILSQAHLMTATTQQTTTTATTTTGSLPPSSVSSKRRAEGNHHTDSSQAVKKMMTRCDPVCGVKVGVKAEIQDEKVWRPW